MMRLGLVVVGPLLALSAVRCKAQAGGAPEPSATVGALPPQRPAGHLRFTTPPAAGDVEPIVRDAMGKAAAEKRRLVVYEGATWCEPCQRFHRAADRGELDATFPDVTFIEFDADRDGERLASAGYVSKYIPLFALPAKDGSASGKQVEGGARGEAAVASITPRLSALLVAP